MASEMEARRSEFEQAALPHVHSLYGVALKMTRRPEEAEDLVQETFLRAFRFFDRYEAGTNVRAWLFKIMRNLFINRYRKDQREPDLLDYGGVEEALDAMLRSESGAGVPPTPEQILVDGSLDAEVERALRELPPEYRMVLLLSAMEGFSYKEIAAALSCPIGTVMSRLHRARRLMQKKLMDYARERGMIRVPPRDTAGVVDLASIRKARGE